MVQSIFLFSVLPIFPKAPRSPNATRTRPAEREQRDIRARFQEWLKVKDLCRLAAVRVHTPDSGLDILVNRWDQFIAVRHGVVEAVWDIPARGCHH